MAFLLMQKYISWGGNMERIKYFSNSSFPVLINDSIIESVLNEYVQNRKLRNIDDMTEIYNIKKYFQSGLCPKELIEVYGETVNTVCGGGKIF
jgi:hypothetical protein